MSNDVAQGFDLDREIAEAVERDRQLSEAKELAKKLAKEEEQQAAIETLKQQLNAVLNPALQRAINLEVRYQGDKAIAAFPLVDEHTKQCEGVIIKLNASVSNNWRIRIPRLQVQGSDRYLDKHGNGGTSIDCEPRDMQQTMLCVLGYWRNEVAQLSKKKAEKEEADRAAAEKSRIEREQELLESQRQQQIESAENERRLTVHQEIEKMIEVLIDEARWQWPEDKTITVYHWTWQKGQFNGSDGVEADYESAYSLSDYLDEAGYFPSVDGRRIKIIPLGNCPVIPVVEEFHWSSFEDLPAQFRKACNINIHGATWSDGFLKYAEDGLIPHRRMVPVAWIRELLNASPLVEDVTINPPVKLDNN